MHLISSDDAGPRGPTRSSTSSSSGPSARRARATRDFYDSGPVLAEDEGGDLVIVYNGASEPLGPRTVYSRSSIDGGRTWSDRVAISAPGVNSAFPAAAGFGDDEARLWFMDQRTGRWNVWYTTTTDLGATWSTPVRISDATSGTAYKNRRGFTEVYGDYGEIAITSAGTTVARLGRGVQLLRPRRRLVQPRAVGRARFVRGVAFARPRGVLAFGLRAEPAAERAADARACWSRNRSTRPRTTPAIENPWSVDQRRS